MFKKLRTKFLLMYMGTVAILVFVLFALVIIFQLNDINRASNAELHNIESNYLFKNSPDPNNKDLPRFPTPIIVWLNVNKVITNVKSTNKMEDNYYRTLTQTALSQNKTIGEFKINDTYFRYKVAESRIIFLDISRDAQMLLRMIKTFLWVVVPMLFIIFLASFYFADKAIKPIEQADKKQKEFIANASHELKTPLTAISANVDVLLADANESRGKWLSNIKAETQRMAKLTGNLLYLTKMDYEGTGEKPETIDLSSLTEKYLLPVEAVFFEKWIKIDINLSPNVQIKADPEQILQMIGVLIDNAVKYTGGEIKISLEKAHHDAKLTVYNNGEGISKEDLPKIWDRFYRGDKSREYTGGFGLGLPIAKSITERFKGTIEAQSSPGEWTKFIVKIQLA
ncbi:MAG: HAMP domain-containing sensor histidine kinase [Eubacteriales bacterium]